MSLPSRINLVTLGVANVATSTAFYERLGWTKSPVSNDDVTFFYSEGTVLGLFGRASLADDANVNDLELGYSAVALAQNFASEAEVDEAYRHALACGAEPRKSPQKVFWGGYSGYFADPDGHLWELAHNPFISLDERGHMCLP
ncbi:MAG: VOC family protein [Pirellulaceae bacterium]|nr:VOC family protein [Planctomycetales bacterium]